MSICIRRDYQSATHDTFRVTANESQFGRWTKRQLKLDQAVALIAHYYGAKHSKRNCPQCTAKEI